VLLNTTGVGNTAMGNTTSNASSNTTNQCVQSLSI